MWQQSDGARSNIWSNRYTPGTGWSPAAPIETDNAGSAYDPKIAIDASRNAVAVWHQYDGLRDNIWANRYTAGTGWGTAALIETDNAENASGPQIAFDANGNAMAVWRQSDDGSRYDIWVNRYTAGTGWGTAVLIETDNAGDAVPSRSPSTPTAMPWRCGHSGTGRATTSGPTAFSKAGAFWLPGARDPSRFRRHYRGIQRSRRRFSCCSE